MLRRPSQVSTAGSGLRASTSTVNSERGPITKGRENSAWAESGTSSTASTSGHMIGPPAEKAWAVDPVAVEDPTNLRDHLSAAYDELITLGLAAG